MAAGNGHELAATETGYDNADLNSLSTVGAQANYISAVLKQHGAQKYSGATMYSMRGFVADLPTDCTHVGAVKSSLRQKAPNRMLV